MSETNSYFYVIERADDGSCWAYLPDLLGCTTTADTPVEIEQQLPERVSLYLSYYRDRGLPTLPPQAHVGILTGV